MLKLILPILTYIASIASILSLYFGVLPLSETRPPWHWVVIGVVATLIVGFIGWEIYEFVKTQPKSYRSQKKINSYMCRWVSSGGRAVIFSRDMSWANEEKVKNILIEKAKRHELAICLEKSVDLTAVLAKQGAQIITYGELGHVPRSRFTIVDFDKEGARVAVGVHENGVHVIQEFRSGAHPFFAVAEDLVKFLIAGHRTAHVA